MSEENNVAQMMLKLIYCQNFYFSHFYFLFHIHRSYILSVSIVVKRKFRIPISHLNHSITRTWVRDNTRIIQPIVGRNKMFQIKTFITDLYFISSRLFFGAPVSECLTSVKEWVQNAHFGHILV